MSAGSTFIAWLAARIVQPLTSSEYMGGGGPTLSTAQSGARSEEIATSAPSDSSVRSLSLDVESIVLAPRRRARWKKVSERM